MTFNWLISTYDFKDMQIVHWKPGRYEAIMLKNISVTLSQLFVLPPLSPGKWWKRFECQIQSRLLGGGGYTGSCWKAWKQCSGKWQEKNIAGKNRVAGLERLICLSAPLWRDGQGETNIFWESIGRLIKNLNPMPLAMDIIFRSNALNGKALRSIMPFMQMNDWYFSSARWKLPIGWTINKRQNLSGKSKATGFFFGKYWELHFRKTGGNCQQEINRTEQSGRGAGFVLGYVSIL